MAAKKLKGFDDIDAETAGPEPEAPEDTVVDLDAETDEDDDHEEQRPTRKEKKGRRTWMNAEAREELERRALAAEAQAQANANAFNAVQALIQRLPTGQQAPQQTDPIDGELERVDKDYLSLQQRYRMRAGDTKNPITEKEMEELNLEALKLDRKRTELAVAKHTRGGPAPQQMDPRQQAFQMYVFSKWPEAASTPAALQFAHSKQLEAQAMGKNPLSMEVIDSAMDAAERQFRLGKYKSGAPRSPDPVLRDRYQSAPRGSSGSANNGPRQVTMTKELRRMADKAFPHIKDEKKRYEKFAREVMTEEE